MIWFWYTAGFVGEAVKGRWWVEKRITKTPEAEDSVNRATEIPSDS